MKQNNQPIGIFDSGVGGLTVANAICKAMPHESIIYFGDTAHLPYGDKSAHAVQHYSETITQFLINKGCKAVVVACNTASAAAFSSLQKKFGGQVLLANVIEPMIDYITLKYSQKRIGIIATKGTVAANVYEKKLAKQDIVQVKSLATPLLVHLIEEGFSKHPGSNLLVKEYLDNPKLKNIEVLVLACTHYPILRTIIESHYNQKVEVLDATAITAQYLFELIQHKNLLNIRQDKPQHKFYVSDYTPAFEEITKIFWGKTIHLEKKDIWS
jgi:glutamate racemase